MSFQPGNPSNQVAVPRDLAGRWGRHVRTAVLILTGMMCAYVATAIWSGRGDALRAIRGMSLGAPLTVVGMMLLGLALRACRWHYYVCRLNWNVPLHRSLCVFLASFAFTATPGKAGEAVKSVLLHDRDGVPPTESLGVLLIERLGDLIAVLILAMGGLALLADAWVYFLMCALLVGGMALFVGNRSIYRPLLLYVGRVPRLSGIVDKVIRLLDVGRTLLRPFPFLVGVGIAAIAWGCEAWGFHVLIRHFGVNEHVTISFSVYGLATLIGALSALPGGLGSCEAMMIVLLSRLGMPASTAALPVVLFRFCTLWLGSLIGLVFMLGWLSVRVPVPAENTSEHSS